jgi:DNA-binding NarL/FixJ family response regulator
MSVNGTSPLRVLVVDADPGSRTGLVSLLGDSDEVEVVGEVGSGPRAAELTQQLGPDIVLLNAQTAGGQADALCRLARVFLLTGKDSQEGSGGLGATRALGRLDHSSFTAGALIKSVREVNRAGLGLSNREAEIMDLIASGRSNGEIARELFLSEKTVKNHVNHIYSKIGISNRGTAIALWRGAAAHAYPAAPARSTTRTQETTGDVQ